MFLHLSISIALHYMFGSFTSHLTKIYYAKKTQLLNSSKDNVNLIMLLQSLYWLPVHLRIEFKILLYVFKSINNLAPRYLSDQLYPYNPTLNLRSGDQRLLSVPRSGLKYRGIEPLRLLVLDCVTAFQPTSDPHSL